MDCFQIKYFGFYEPERKKKHRERKRDGGRHAELVRAVSERGRQTETAGDTGPRVMPDVFRQAGRCGSQTVRNERTQTSVERTQIYI